MKNLITCLTFTAYVCGNTVGYAGGVRVVAAEPSARSYHSTKINYDEAKAAYEKVGPQGLIDSARVKYDSKDQRFIFSLLQSKNQVFPQLANVTVGMTGDEFLIPVSGTETWSFKVVNHAKGQFELNGEPVQLNFKHTMAQNHAVLKAVAEKQQKNKTNSVVQTSSWSSMRDNFWAKVSQMILPQAHAQMMTWILIGVAVLVALFLAYNFGKSKQKTASDAEWEAKIAEEKAAAEVAAKADDTSVVHTGSDTGSTGSEVTRD